MNKKVSIILINYNGLAFNKACIDSLLLQSYKLFEIIFIDNASIDGSVEEVEMIFANKISEGKIKIIKSDANLGFAQGNNIGVLHSDKNSGYICMLNNDTTVPHDRLEELVKGIESDNELGLVGSFVLDKGSEDNLRDLYFNQKKGGINNYIFETSFKSLSQKEIDTGIFYTTGIGGCALLYKKELIDRPFPGFYFAYAEDTFLSICIVLQGYKLAVCSKSIVNHFGSGSFGKGITVFKAFHGTKNGICNNLILHSRKNLYKLIPTLLLYNLVKAASGNPLIRIKGLGKAVWRCFKNRDMIAEERKYIKSLQKITDSALLRELSSTIFENIYFIPLPRIIVRSLSILNGICAIYFTLVGIPLQKKSS